MGIWIFAGDNFRLWKGLQGLLSGVAKRTRSHISFASASALALVGVLLLAGCGAPSGDVRPSDSSLVTGINLLVSTFGANHPKMVNWDTAALKAQLGQRLPVGIDTDAGWFLQWPNATKGQLSQVIVPWALLGQFPNHPLPYFNRYKGGNLVPQATSLELVKNVIKAEMQGDQYFGAVVNIRSSAINPQWIIFTTVPYLPVTDIATGFATVKNGQWSVIDFGTALVGCGTVPLNVESEFGYKCP